MATIQHAFAFFAILTIALGVVFFWATGIKRMREEGIMPLDWGKVILLLVLMLMASVSKCGPAPGETTLHWLAANQSTQGTWKIYSWGNSICAGEDGQFVTKTDGMRAPMLLELFVNNGTLAFFEGDEQPFFQSTEFPWGPGYTSAIGGQTSEQSYATLQSDLATVCPSPTNNCLFIFGPINTNDVTAGQTMAQMQAADTDCMAYTAAYCTNTAGTGCRPPIAIVSDLQRSDGFSENAAWAAETNTVAVGQANGYNVYFISISGCVTAADSSWDGGLHLNRYGNYKCGKCEADRLVQTIPGL